MVKITFCDGSAWFRPRLPGDATSTYKAEALGLQRQLRQLQTQYDMLTSQASALIQGRRARVAATSTVNGQLTAIDDSLSVRNLEMNAVLGRIASTAQELVHYHSGDEDDIYLAYSDFHPYLILDASCMQELNHWVLIDWLLRRAKLNVHGSILCLNMLPYEVKICQLRTNLDPRLLGMKCSPDFLQHLLDLNKHPPLEFVSFSAHYWHARHTLV
ncbi:hypothetical protein TEA_008630 [Camellia sinensis var. sinensis]|uniref:HAUS augmin-like complex subunit 3 N-terminal domain-containing protein n=1 Tax=Camellia sinensis var. sinensis TaxID=542762 RepID=A0A4V6RYM5_CAMSN|nr:hypothetical protein TEA_008630 [Camellia sinensis var. sinensis]